MAEQGTLKVRPRILVIEDEVLIRLIISDFLSDAGFEVLEAGDADEALLILEARDDIRVIFTDINMPGLMSGLELSHAIRRRWPPIHIIITSGNPPRDRSCLPMGSRFFDKPYDCEHIVACVEGLAA